MPKADGTDKQAELKREDPEKYAAYDQYASEAGEKLQKFAVQIQENPEYLRLWELSFNQGDELKKSDIEKDPDNKEMRKAARLYNRIFAPIQEQMDEGKIGYEFGNDSPNTFSFAIKGGDKGQLEYVSNMHKVGVLHYLAMDGKDVGFRDDAMPQNIEYPQGVEAPKVTLKKPGEILAEKRAQEQQMSVEELNEKLTAIKTKQDQIEEELKKLRPDAEKLSNADNGPMSEQDMQLRDRLEELEDDADYLREEQKRLQDVVKAKAPKQEEVQSEEPKQQEPKAEEPKEEVKQEEEVVTLPKVPVATLYREDPQKYAAYDKYVSEAEEKLQKFAAQIEESPEYLRLWELSVNQGKNLRRSDITKDPDDKEMRKALRLYNRIFAPVKEQMDAGNIGHEFGFDKPNTFDLAVDGEQQEQIEYVSNMHKLGVLHYLAMDRKDVGIRDDAMPKDIEYPQDAGVPKVTLRKPSEILAEKKEQEKSMTVEELNEKMSVIKTKQDQIEEELKKLRPEAEKLSNAKNVPMSREDMQLRDRLEELEDDADYLKKEHERLQNVVKENEQEAQKRANFEKYAKEWKEKLEKYAEQIQNSPEYLQLWELKSNQGDNLKDGDIENGTKDSIDDKEMRKAARLYDRVFAPIKEELDKFQLGFNFPAFSGDFDDRPPVYTRYNNTKNVENLKKASVLHYLAMDNKRVQLLVNLVDMPEDVQVPENPWITFELKKPSEVLKQKKAQEQQMSVEELDAKLADITAKLETIDDELKRTLPEREKFRQEQNELKEQTGLNEEQEKARKKKEKELNKIGAQLREKFEELQDDADYLRKEYDRLTELRNEKAKGLAAAQNVSFDQIQEPKQEEVKPEEVKQEAPKQEAEQEQPIQQAQVLDEREELYAKMKVGMDLLNLVNDNLNLMRRLSDEFILRSEDSNDHFRQISQELKKLADMDSENSLNGILEQMNEVYQLANNYTEMEAENRNERHARENRLHLNEALKEQLTTSFNNMNTFLDDNQLEKERSIRFHLTELHQEKEELQTGQDMVDDAKNAEAVSEDLLRIVVVAKEELKAFDDLKVNPEKDSKQFTNMHNALKGLARLKPSDNLLAYQKALGELNSTSLAYRKKIEIKGGGHGLNGSARLKEADRLAKFTENRLQFSELCNHLDVERPIWEQRNPNATDSYQRMLDYVDELFKVKGTARWYSGANKVISGGEHGFGDVQEALDKFCDMGVKNTPQEIRDSFKNVLKVAQNYIDAFQGQTSEEAVGKEEARRIRYVQKMQEKMAVHQETLEKLRYGSIPMVKTDHSTVEQRIMKEEMNRRLNQTEEVKAWKEENARKGEIALNTKLEKIQRLQQELNGLSGGNRSTEFNNMKTAVDELAGMNTDSHTALELMDGFYKVYGAANAYVSKIKYKGQGKGWSGSDRLKSAKELCKVSEKMLEMGYELRGLDLVSASIGNQKKVVSHRLMQQEEIFGSDRQNGRRGNSRSLDEKNNIMSNDSKNRQRGKK